MADLWWFIENYARSGIRRAERRLRRPGELGEELQWWSAGAPYRQRPGSGQPHQPRFFSLNGWPKPMSQWTVGRSTPLDWHLEEQKVTPEGRVASERHALLHHGPGSATAVATVKTAAHSSGLPPSLSALSFSLVTKLSEGRMNASC